MRSQALVRLAVGIVGCLSLDSDLAAQTQRISETSGTEANAASFSAHPSLLGNYVAFDSAASNLVSGDTNGAADVFVWDRGRRIECVSVSSAGQPGNMQSLQPAISEDGDFVAFMSNASNLVPKDTNNLGDVFLRDRYAGVTVVVSVDIGGRVANGISAAPAVSRRGAFVAFDSNATNLVAGDTNGFHDVFVRSMAQAATERVSVASSGQQGNGTARFPSISSNGRWVVFESSSSNLVAGDTNGKTDIFLHDRTTMITERISVSSTGAEGNDHSSSTTSVDRSGRYVVFTSMASNLVPGDTNAAADVFIRDRSAGTTTRVSVDSNGAQGNGHSALGTISATGDRVGFQSDASNLVLADTNGSTDIFLKDLASGLVQRASVDSHGNEVIGYSRGAAICGTGACLSFLSDSDMLVPLDTNTVTDVFLHFP
jgi:Tol biopolymer transport system component